MPVLAILLGVLAVVYAINATPLRWIYRIVPILVFCYFTPTALSNTGVIPGSPPVEGLPKYPLYGFITDWLLPASLLLMVLAVDIRAILRLGRPAVLLFLTAAVSVVVGGPLAFGALGWMFDAEQSDQAWRGLAALSGSWIGGGANFTSIGRSVEASDTMLSVMVVIDVAMANLWMIALLFFAGRHREMDAAVGADTRQIDAVREKAEAYEAQVAAPTDLPALLTILALGIGGTVLATECGAWIDGRLHKALPPTADGSEHPLFSVLGPFTWKVILVTALGVALSFTRLRRLEGKGAGKVGAVFLYVLVASIGAKADFMRVFTPENLPLLAVGAVWMAFHVAAVLTVRRLMRAPIFFAAVGSKACISGAASAPIIAAAFSPPLAPVGVLLAIGGYVLGTAGGIVCAFLLEGVHHLWHG